MKKNWFFLILMLAFNIILFTSCTQNANVQKPQEATFDWEKAEAIPFSGYICANAGSSIYIQIPFVYPLSETCTANNLSKVTLLGDMDVNIPCDSFDFSQESENSDLKMATFKFNANFEHAGIYKVNQLEVIVSKKNPVIFNLDEIEFLITPPEENVLECVEYVGLTSNLSPLRVALKNSGSADVEITGFSFSSQMFDGIKSMEFYTDFNLEEKSATANIIPAGKEITVCVEMFQNTAYQGRNVLLLPLVEYTYSGNKFSMPAQHSVTIIQPPFEDTYLLSILGKNN